MMGMAHRASLVALSMITIGFSACSKPPVAETEAADRALDAAMAAGAQDYAPTSLASARDLRNELQAELAAQERKSAVTRSYDQAMDLAIQVKAAADQTALEATTTKEQVRQETSTLLQDVKDTLAEVRAMLATAPRGKGSAVDLAALTADLDSAQTTLTEGETAMAEGRYLDARAKVLAVQNSTQSVKSAIEMALRARTRTTR